MKQSNTVTQLERSRTTLQRSSREEEPNCNTALEKKNNTATQRWRRRATLLFGK